MKKNLTVTMVMTSLMFMSGASIASAEEAMTTSATPVTTSASTDTAALQAKVQMLIKQLEELKASAAAKKAAGEMTKGDAMMMKGEAMMVKDALQLAKRQLRIGSTGEDVRILQETLATDPDIYPEGLVTGTFGPLTAKALKRFQEKNGLEAVGEAGPKTREILNRMLAEGGAGKSGKIPAGLLRNAGNMISVHLKGLNDSNLNGVATIRDNAEGKAVVSIKIHKGGAMMAKGDAMMAQGDAMMAQGDAMMYEDASVKHPAHIHLGSCAVPGAVKYPLTAVAGGKSETVLPVSAKEVLAGLPLMINIHKSPTEAAIYVACGDITAPAMMMKHDAMMMKKDDAMMKKEDAMMKHDAMMTSAKVSTVTLNTIGDSGLKGVAVMKDNADGKAVVTVELKKADGTLDDATARPAHIHLGSCAVPGAVKYPLTAVAGGKSETVLPVSVKEVLAALPLMVNIHKSPTEAAIYVACGDIAA